MFVLFYDLLLEKFSSAFYPVMSLTRPYFMNPLPLFKKYFIAY